MQEVSAGILIYRINSITKELEVLLGKCGGPAWENRSCGAWNIPKGHVEQNENILDCAIREFEEETSLHIPKDRLTELTYIGTAKTSQNKKVVHIYVLNYDFAPNKFAVEIKSNLIETEYPKNSGNIIQVPELSEAYYFNILTAKNLIFKYQQVFLDRLTELIGSEQCI